MLQRSDLIEALKRFTHPQLDTAGLAAWAMQQFYAIEQERQSLAEQDRDELLTILDELMFADQEPFVLSDADVRRLIDTLTKP